MGKNRSKDLIFKKPLYQGVEFSANEDKAIEILKKNGFTSTVIAEVLGRKNYSVRNRSIYKSFYYKSQKNVDLIKNTENYEKLKTSKRWW